MKFARSRWAALGAATALVAGVGGVGLVDATGGSEASEFVANVPCRMLDTRGDGALGATDVITLAGQGSVGDCDIPADATALSINIAAVGPSSDTFLTVFPSGEAMPVSSHVNATVGVTTSNGVVVALSDAGALDVYNNRGDVNVIIDLLGAYVPATAGGPAGPQGPRGDTGIQGTVGPQGTTGPPGVAGPQGETGSQGTVGAQGDTGPVGPQGATGATGAQGDVGPKGEIGATGAQGDIGNTGPQGAQGDTGATGGQGPQGEIGATGAQGNTGSQGPQGVDGGAPRILYVDLELGLGVYDTTSAYYSLIVAMEPCLVDEVMIGGRIVAPPVGADDYLNVLHNGVEAPSVLLFGGDSVFAELTLYEPQPAAGWPQTRTENVAIACGAEVII